jgi:hypothetical protein
MGWLMSVISVTREAGIGRNGVQGQPKQKLGRLQQKKYQHGGAHLSFLLHRRHKYEDQCAPLTKNTRPY